MPPCDNPFAQKSPTRTCAQSGEQHVQGITLPANDQAPCSHQSTVASTTANVGHNVRNGQQTEAAQPPAQLSTDGVQELALLISPQTSVQAQEDTVASHAELQNSPNDSHCRDPIRKSARTELTASNPAIPSSPTVGASTCPSQSAETQQTTTLPSIDGAGHDETSIRLPLEGPATFRDTHATSHDSVLNMGNPNSLLSISDPTPSIAPAAGADAATGMTSGGQTRFETKMDEALVHASLKPAFESQAHMVEQGQRLSCRDEGLISWELDHTPCIGRRSNSQISRVHMEAGHEKVGELPIVAEEAGISLSPRHPNALAEPLIEALAAAAADAEAALKLVLSPPAM